MHSASYNKFQSKKKLNEIKKRINSRLSFVFSLETVALVSKLAQPI